MTEEKNKTFLSEAVDSLKSLGELNKKIPIDILVYTIPEYEELKRINSSFCREIHQSGKIMYEKAS